MPDSAQGPWPTCWWCINGRKPQRLCSQTPNYAQPLSAQREHFQSCNIQGKAIHVGIHSFKAAACEKDGSLRSSRLVAHKLCTLAPSWRRDCSTQKHGLAYFFRVPFNSAIIPAGVPCSGLQICLPEDATYQLSGLSSQQTATWKSAI